MGKVVKIGENGEIIYIGMLSSHEKAAIDEIIATIQEEIPTIESELAEKYGKGLQVLFGQSARAAADTL